MNTGFVWYWMIAGVSILVALVCRKVVARFRIANVPKAAAAAIESRWPDSCKLSVEWDEVSRSYEIEVLDGHDYYAVIVRPDGEIVRVDSASEPDLLMGAPDVLSLKKSVASGAKRGILGGACQKIPPCVPLDPRPAAAHDSSQRSNLPCQLLGFVKLD